MKKRIIFSMVLFLMIGTMAACQKAEEENGGLGLDTQETAEVGTEDGAGDDDEEDAEESPSDEAERNGNDTAENDGEKTYDIDEYGVVEEKQQEYFADGTDGDDAEAAVYYYRMENFFFNDSFPNAAAINDTLRQIYAGYEEAYAGSAEVYISDAEEEGPNTPNAYWHLLSLAYVGDDYVSILYNDVDDMGGAHAYSSFDGITVDCGTGEEVSAAQLLGKSDEELLAQVSGEMGLDVAATWKDIDFYLTDSAVVFFYRMPGFWEDVVWERDIN